MQTDIVCAYQLAGGDIVLGDDGSKSEVLDLVDDRDLMEFRVLDLDTEVSEPMYFAPFDVVTIITNFEDEDPDLEV